MVSLHVGSLKVPSDSLTIGPVHKRVLKEKRDQLEQELFRKRAELEGRTSTATSRASSGSGNPNISLDQRTNNQEELNKLQEKYQTNLQQLYERFQKEWMADPREKDTRCMKVEPPSGSDGPYLAKAVGIALAEALAEVCVQKPPDPIEYLAHLLRKHAENTQRAQEKAVLSLKTKVTQEEHHMSLEKSQQMLREQDQIKQEDERRKEIFLKTSPRPEEDTTPSASPKPNFGGSNTTDPSAGDTGEKKLYTITE